MAQVCESFGHTMVKDWQQNGRLARVCPCDNGKCSVKPFTEMEHTRVSVHAVLPNLIMDRETMPSIYLVHNNNTMTH